MPPDGARGANRVVRLREARDPASPHEIARRRAEFFAFLDEMRRWEAEPEATEATRPPSRVIDAVPRLLRGGSS